MSKYYITINPDVCKGCWICIESCPKHCIVANSSINKLGYQYAEFKSSECIGCGICFYVCPEFSTITVYKNEEKVK